MIRRNIAQAALIFLGMALGISTAFLIARMIRLKEGRAELRDYARRLVKIGDQLGLEDDQARAAVLHDNLPFCSDQEIAFMRDYVFRSAHIRDIGRVKDDKLYCTSAIGRLKTPIVKAPADITSGNVRIYLRFPLLISSSTFGLIIESNGVSNVLNPDTIHTVQEPPKFYGSFLFDRHNNRIFQTDGPSIPLTLNEIVAGNPIERNGVFYQPLCSKTPMVCSVAAESRDNLLAAGGGGLFRGFLTGGVLLGTALALILILFQKRQFSVERQLRRAIRKGSLTLAYESIVDLESRAIVGAEVLVRWVNEAGETVKPEIFVALAEEKGFVTQITQLVVKRTIEELGDLLRSGTFGVTVNITAQDLVNPVFFEELSQSLSQAKISPSAVGLELTERSTADHELAIHAISQLKKAGHSVYVDDFGTGYSSLAYLHQLAASAIKIDRVFTRTVGTESVAASVVPQILDMAAQLNLVVVVEGIETEQQAEYFRRTRFGVLGQGWLFGRPVPEPEFRARLAANARESEWVHSSSA
jgi:sensor c-di-GMP phosphodiesterase-like protein